LAEPSLQYEGDYGRSEDQPPIEPVDEQAYRPLQFKTPVKGT
jgi:hypothetical protein